MTAAATVSVLIPTTGRATLGEALASVAAQEYPASGIQVVVEPDGADGAALTGQSATVNRAFARAHGEFVTVLHDDDLIYPGKIRTLVAALERQPDMDVAYALAARVELGGAPVGLSLAARRYLDENPVVTWDTIKARRGLLIHGTATMYRRAAWVDAGPWDETLPTAEEWEFHLRLLSRGARFVGVDAVTDAYRIHDGQKSSRRQRRTVTRKATLARINARYEALLREVA